MKAYRKPLEDDRRLSPRGPNHHRKHKHNDSYSPLVLDNDPREDELGEIVGSATGEFDHDVIPGGWEGTDDATSTSPSDLANPQSPQFREDLDSAEFQDAVIGRAAGGGLGRNEGGVSDIKGSPVEDSRNWEDDPIEEET